MSIYLAFQGLVLTKYLLMAHLNDESVRTKFTDIVLISERHGFKL